MDKHHPLPNSRDTGPDGVARRRIIRRPDSTPEQSKTPSEPRLPIGYGEPDSSCEVCGARCHGRRCRGCIRNR